MDMDEISADDNGISHFAPNAPDEVKKAMAEAMEETGYEMEGKMNFISQMLVKQVENSHNGIDNPNDIFGSTVESALNAAKEMLSSLANTLNESGGEEAAAVVPPPPRELALCAFLMANEYDKTLDGMIGEFLPPKVFAHDFTRRFVETWRAEVVKNEDLLQDFAGKLEGHEREWFDSVLLSGSKTESSGLSPTDILQDFVRALWADELKRERGSLPANGDAEADLRRMKLSMDLKRLSSVRWAAVKDSTRHRFR